MVSRKRTFEEDDAVDGTSPAGSARRKIAKTEARVKKSAELDVRADAAKVAPMTRTAQVEQLAPTAPVGPTLSTPVPGPTSASGPLSIPKGMSDNENEGPSMPSNSLRKDKGKGLAPRDPPDTAADLYKKEMWRKEWEKETKERISTEMMEAARSQLEYRFKSEKKEWEAMAIEKVDEQIEAVKQVFQQQVTKALEEAQKAEAHAKTQTELSSRIWDDLQTKQAEVDFLQACLNEVNTSSAEGLVKDIQSNATALLVQKDLEIQKLVSESTKAKYDMENSNKARHDAVEEVATHAAEIKNLEERLEMARGENRDLNSAGVKKDKKIDQLERALGGGQKLCQASQKLAKEPKASKGENQARTRDSNATNESNVDEHHLKETMATSRRNELLVSALRSKLTRQANESDAELKKLKMEMAAGLKQAMEEKEKVVRRLKLVEDSEELRKLNHEHKIFKRRNQDMARKALEDAADINHLNTQTKLLYSAHQRLLHENHTLEQRGNSFKSKFLLQSNLLDDANSQIIMLTRRISSGECELAKTVRAQNLEIKALKKTVRARENTIFTLRQWDAESGVTERDELIKERDRIIKTRDRTIQQLEKDVEECLDHIRKLEQKIFERQNVGFLVKLSSWVVGRRF